MNNRIKDLMIKSGAFDHYEVNEGVDGDELPMVKFAELIIGECLDMCLTKVGNGDYNRGRMDCHDNIKEHFGVGE